MAESKSRTILVIDDNKTNLALLKVHLQQMSLGVLLAQNAHTGIEMATNQQPDMVLLDVMMPSLDGFEVCRRLKADVRTAAIPIIFVSAKDQSGDKVKGLQLGAVDYITKPFNPAELKTRISIILQMITLQEDLVAKANTDPLTGLANRRHFFEILDRELLQAKMQGNTLAIIMIDLDYFKRVNDTYGHLGGDIVLKQLANILRANIYPLDVPARYGGEEFIILMPDTSSQKAVTAANKLCDITRKCNWKVSAAEKVIITASFGTVTFNPYDPIDAGELVKRADTALYAAKSQGRDRVVCWEEVDLNEKPILQKKSEISELQKEISSLTEKVHKQDMAVVSAFAEVIAAKNVCMSCHAKNTYKYFVAIADQMNLDSQFKEEMELAVALHDIGKIGIPDSILHKTTELSAQEHDLMRQHPAISTKILSPLGISEQKLKIIRHHCEYFDGSGYPAGLRGKEIPFGARVLAVACAFDTLTSDRPGRDALSYADALQEIANSLGTKFDPDIVAGLQKAAQEHQEEWPLFTKEQADDPVALCAR